VTTSLVETRLRHADAAYECRHSTRPASRTTKAAEYRNSAAPRDEFIDAERSHFTTADQVILQPCIASRTAEGPRAADQFRIAAN
jgi:hypothetical protein